MQALVLVRTRGIWLIFVGVLPAAPAFADTVLSFGPSEILVHIALFRAMDQFGQAASVSHGRPRPPTLRIKRFGSQPVIARNPLAVSRCDRRPHADGSAADGSAASRRSSTRRAPVDDDGHTGLRSGHHRLTRKRDPSGLASYP